MCVCIHIPSQFFPVNIVHRIHIGIVIKFITLSVAGMILSHNLDLTRVKIKTTLKF